MHLLVTGLSGTLAPRLATLAERQGWRISGWDRRAIPADGGPVARQALESKALAAYNAKPSMQTYFVVLDDDAHDGPTVALPFYQQMQTDLPQAVTVKSPA